MPLTGKGTEVLTAMEKTYGSKEKAEQVLYASKNAGKITGIDAIVDAVSAMCDAVDKFSARFDAHNVIGGVQIPPTPEQIKNNLGLRFDALTDRTKAMKRA